jgi:hypothetical protein
VYKHILPTSGLSTTRRLPIPMSTPSHCYRPVTIEARVNKDNQEGNLNAATVPYKSYKLNAHSNSIINQVLNIKHKDFVGCTRACIDHNNISIIVTWCLCTSEYPLDFLLRLNFHFWLRGGLSYMQKMANIKNVQCMGCKVQYDIWSKAS